MVRPNPLGWLRYLIVESCWLLEGQPIWMLCLNSPWSVRDIGHVSFLLELVCVERWRINEVGQGLLFYFSKSWDQSPDWVSVLSGSGTSVNASRHALCQSQRQDQLMLRQLWRLKGLAGFAIEDSSPLHKTSTLDFCNFLLWLSDCDTWYLVLQPHETIYTGRCLAVLILLLIGPVACGRLGQQLVRTVFYY